MRTPSGIDCPYFFGDYFRGRSIEECRLITAKPPAEQWTRDLCQSCPVPDITRSNACENMTLYATIKKKFLQKNRHVIVTAYCSKSKSEVTEPRVGCGICHQDIDSLSSMK